MVGVFKYVVNFWVIKIFSMFGECEYVDFGWGVDYNSLFIVDDLLFGDVVKVKFWYVFVCVFMVYNKDNFRVNVLIDNLFDCENVMLGDMVL